jgi:hypothetical protein
MHRTVAWFLTFSCTIGRKYDFQSPSLPDEALPTIPSEEVASKQRAQTLCDSAQWANGGCKVWIVIENIVYDCTSFISEHPGGEQVIFSFMGHDCSWQFWRFHSKDILDQHGRELRIGRTSGAVNRFKEPPRYVGLSKLGDDDW